MAKMGFRKLSEMVGRCDYLEPADPLNEKVKVHFVAVLLCPISRKKNHNHHNHPILFVCFFFCSQLLDFSAILMPGNELNPGDHLGGSEPQNHKLELRKVSIGHEPTRLGRVHEVKLFFQNNWVIRPFCFFPRQV